jgi:predicted lactoylglutathione lyase
MNGEDLTQVGAEVSDIEKSIDVLSEKGYDSNRIMEVMSSVGYDSNQVYNEFVRRHEDERQRMLEEKERADALFQQQRDAYDGLLKKKTHRQNKMGSPWI